MQIVYGVIRRIHLKERIFEIKIRDKIQYFYLTRSQMKQFNVYLQPGLFVHLKCHDNQLPHVIFTGRRKTKILAYEVVNFVKMIRRSQSKMTVYFDLTTIRRGVQSVLNKKGYRMFLDLEFTLPPYSFQGGQEFVAEIVQYGFYLEDEKGQVILKEQSLIKPKRHSGLNLRTYKFLNLKKSDFQNAISFRTFYYRLKDIINLYQPTIYVWGKNDIKVLERAYELHKLKPITMRMNFINLMQILKNYYGIKTDIGLFNAFAFFDEEIPETQDHDALQDAMMTRNLFHLFKQSFNNL